MAVREVVRAAYSPYIARIGREPGPMGDDYAALIADGRVWVIDGEDAVEAVLVLVPGEGAMLLDNVAVEPEAQGRGVGAALMTFAEAEAARAGYDTVRLYTNEAMTENIARYARLGYSETRRGQENGFRRVFMAKRLG